MLLLFLTSAARAEEPQFAFGDDDCPDPRVLQAEIVRLTPQERRQELFDRVRVNVTDRGDSYRVTLITPDDRQDKSFADPNRDCAKRARFAAVFIVVTLFPPELDVEPQAETENPPESEAEPAPSEPGSEPPASERPAPREAPPPAPVVPPPRQELPEEQPFEPIARLELTGDGQLAPALGEAVGVQKAGAAVLAVLGRGSILATLGVGYTFPTRFDAGLVRARMSELPARVGVRFPWVAGPLGFAVDLSVSGAFRRVRGRDAVAPHQASQLGFGARGDFGLFYGLSERVYVLGGAQLGFEPAPSELRALPYGKVGTLPWLWLGARAGLGVAL